MRCGRRKAADEHRRHGRAIGPLHGVPIGIKDIFDTGDMPTELGSPFWAGRTPRADAAAVARLRAAGAVIMGKTVTTEYAFMHPGKTANPHDPARTPGGSSSGSAAAVAAAHGAGRDRRADQRLGDPSGRLLRRGRLQADPWAHPAHRRADAVAHARSCRRVRAQRRGCGTARRGAGRVRPGRSGYAPARAPAARRGGGERAAAAAAFCLRPHARPGSMPSR